MLNRIIAIDAEAKRRDLTGSIRDNRAIEVAILVPEILRLVATESYTDFEIQLLSSIYRLSFVLIWVCQVLHCMIDIWGSNRRKASTINTLHLYPLENSRDETFRVFHDWFDAGENFKANVFTFTITIKPENQVISICQNEIGNILHVLANLAKMMNYTFICFLPNCFG